MPLFGSLVTILTYSNKRQPDQKCRTDRIYNYARKISLLFSLQLYLQLTSYPILSSHNLAYAPIHNFVNKLLIVSTLIIRLLPS